MKNLEFELKTLIVEALSLEDVSPDEISSDEPLFVEGLGLDSIDALEIGVALQKKYGLKVDANSEEVKNKFYSVSTLCKLVEQQSIRSHGR